MAGLASRLRLIASILGVVLAGYAVGTIIDAFRVPGMVLDETPALRDLRDARDAPRLGPDDAGKTVIVFTDYQCSNCRIDEPGLAQTARETPAVRFIFKEWAIISPASGDAARVALASSYQGRYPAVRDALMRARMPLSPDRIREAVEAAGADWQRLERDLARHGRAIDAELARTSRQAFGLGLPGTPAYLVGNRLVVGRLSARQLRRLIDRAE